MLPIDTAFVSAKALDELPNADLLRQAEDILNRLTEKLRGTVNFLRFMNNGCEPIGIAS